ncbi:MAG: SGNH/GDSL hydrolase family protein [Candidatus Nanohaloarchaea archaeon]
MPQIFCLGHSITYGRWDTEGGWTQRLREKLDDISLENEGEEDFQVWNLGIPGEDSRQLLERMDDELGRRIYEPMQQVIILQLGANDIQYLAGEDRIRVTEEEFRANLEKIVEKSREHAEKVVLVSEAFITIDGPIPWAEEKELSDERLEGYVKIQREVSEQENLPFIDLREKFSRQEWEEFLEDGCHPDNQGHRKIFQEVSEKLAEEGIL